MRSSAPALRAQSTPGLDMSAADGAMSGELRPRAHLTMTTLEQLHERAPVSVAEWHMHTNLCLPTVCGWMVHVSPWATDLSLVLGTHEDDDPRTTAGH